MWYEREWPIRYCDWATDWTILGSNLCRGKNVSPLENLQTGSGAHPPCYSMGTGVLPGVKQPVYEVDRSPLLPRLRMSGAIRLLPLYAVMTWTGPDLLYHFKGLFYYMLSCDRSVVTVIMLRSLIFGKVGRGNFSFCPKHLDRLCGPPRPLSNSKY
jgi:hypothetical protein